MSRMSLLVKDHWKVSPGKAFPKEKGVWVLVKPITYTGIYSKRSGEHLISLKCQNTLLIISRSCVHLGSCLHSGDRSSDSNGFQLHNLNIHLILLRAHLKTLNTNLSNIYICLKTITCDTTTSLPVSVSTAWTKPVTVMLPTDRPWTWPRLFTEAMFSWDREKRMLDWGCGPPSDVIYKWTDELSSKQVRIKYIFNLNIKKNSKYEDSSTT